MTRYSHRFIFTGFLLVFISDIQAQDYQTELQYSHESLKYAGLKGSQNLFDLTYYFQPNQAANQPFGAVAFLERHSNLQLEYALNNQSLDGFSADSDTIHVAFNFRGTGSPVLFGIGSGKDNVKSDFFADVSTDILNAYAGMYLSSTTAVWLDFKSETTDLAGITPGRSEVNVRTNSLFMRHARDNGNGSGIDFLASLSKEKEKESGFFDVETTVIDLGVDFYMQKAYMIGVGFQSIDGNEFIVGGTSFAFRAAVQLNPAFIAGLRFENIEDEESDSGQSIRLFTSYRL